MNLRTSDFLLTRFAHHMPGALKLLGDMETDLLRERLHGVALDRPVLIAGLARSGSTILLNQFSSLSRVGTHQYRDFPFLFVPYLWNQFQNRLAHAEAPVERPHQDRITITKNSPEAFEEPIWMHFFPFVHEPHAHHLLTAVNSNAGFDKLYREHLRKILLVRGGQRYVSKGNYNVARLQYIGNLLPDARFVIPIRHPLSHVSSLVRQHRLFNQYGEKDKRVAEYMRNAGHYEFGPQRAPINLDRHNPSRILDAWAKGDDALGYAVMWHSVYAHVHRLARSGPLAGRIAVVHYENFCSEPASELARLFEFCELDEGVAALLHRLPDISMPAADLKHLDEAQRARVWEETADVARAFGYDPDWTSRVAT